MKGGKNPYKAPAKGGRNSYSGPTKKGQLKTSMQEVTKGSAQRPTAQGGGLVSGMPPTFGVGAGAGAKRSGKKASRKRMY
jgi:hypothetical protein